MSKKCIENKYDAEKIKIIFGNEICPVLLAAKYLIEGISRKEGHWGAKGMVHGDANCSYHSDANLFG